MIEKWEIYRYTWESHEWMLADKKLAELGLLGWEPVGISIGWKDENRTVLLKRRLS